MLALRRELVRMDRAVDHKDEVPAGIYRLPCPDAWRGTMGVLSPTKHVTDAHGHQLLDLLLHRLAALLDSAA
jgi:hypothetical protein